MVAAMSLRQGTGEVIVPAISWSTSYTPFQQYGWTLKFIDIDRQTLNYDLKKLKDAYTGNELVLAVNLLGNPNDYQNFPGTEIQHALGQGLLEDNCESMGAEYAGMKTGNFGVMASHSTFFSHHIQTMEGGLITTDDEYYYQMLLCLRSHGWTRHLPEKNVLKAKVSSYEFIYPGYNVRPTELQGAVGAEQVKKLPGIMENRRRNFDAFKEIADKKGWKTQKPIGNPSWFGFAIISDDIEEIKKELDGKNIEYRPILSHFTESPAIQYFNYTNGNLDNANYVYDHAVYIGNYGTEIDWSCL
jgi:CDP-6-deoxy-D-xylo-4-hexulose-3-dehydrase